MRDCRLSGDEKSIGVLLASSEVKIVDTVISNHKIGVGALESSTLEVSGNLLEGNLIGVNVVHSTLNATGNTVIFLPTDEHPSTTEHGFGVANTETLLTKNTVRGYGTGIDVRQSRAEISHNTLTSNSTGIWCNRSRVRNASVQ